LEKATAERDGLSALLDDAKVLQGKHGRLFLSNDSNDVVHQHTGERLLTEQQLVHWRQVLENRFAWLERLGIPYFFLVPPNAHSVYPEDMPDELPQGPTRPALQLIEELETTDFARVIYPLEEIAAAKPDPLLFPLTNSHWSARGGFIAYRRVAEEAARQIPMHVVSEEELDLREVVYTGDLGFKMSPKVESLHVAASVSRPQARLVSDNRIANIGSMIVTECRETPPSTCLMFGDSFAERLLPFFAASFGRFVYAHLPTLDHELVRAEKPDVVVSVLNERFLLQVPYDVGGLTCREAERQKRADERFRAEIQEWPPAGRE
jgi:hypothetical protein